MTSPLKESETRIVQNRSEICFTGIDKQIGNWNQNRYDTQP